MRGARTWIRMEHRYVRNAVLFLLISGGVCLAQPAPDETAPSARVLPETSSNAPSTEGIVAAAKAAKAKRIATKGKKKVITNADVKRAGGRLIFISDGSHQKKSETKKPLSAEDRRTLNQRDDDRIRDRKAAEERLAKATEQLDETNAALAIAEQKYYESNDPGYRDSVLKERFETARTRLESARNDAAAARDELAALEPQS